jgi:hypothetical protein
LGRRYCGGRAPTCASFLSLANKAGQWYRIRQSGATIAEKPLVALIHATEAPRTGGES